MTVPPRIDPTSPAAASQNLVKSLVLRGYVAQLRQLGLFDEVRVRVPESARALLDAPPEASCWVDGVALESVYDAVVALRGTVGLRDLVHRAIDASIGVVTKPLLTTILGMFGASPRAIYERLDMVFRPSLQGLRYGYCPEGERSGEVEVHYLAHTPPRSVFVAWEATVGYAFKVCKVTGSVRPAVVEAGGRSARYAVRW